MNVYDFDKTIYDGDCSIDFYMFSLKRNPALIVFFPKQFLGILMHAFGKINKEQMKEYFFSFIGGIDNVGDEVKRFWDKNEIKIKKWYLEQQKIDDVVISASPDFLLQEICNRKNITCVLATKMDVKNIKILGKNCKGEEKVSRYKMIFSDKKIECFYTDSLSDIPLCKISKEAYIVKGNQIIKWSNAEG